ncbi:hypothetical protein SAY86_016689 [Trapa natans]|uniref:Protein Iojap-related, mitochondrial n=1 Tax=Trapa natans TaxID=22666 RepID=A0AAN7LM93_TRANT|nr:hypothetical protein SAY86_016689 [Trapa natans]
MWAAVPSLLLRSYLPPLPLGLLDQQLRLGFAGLRRFSTSPENIGNRSFLDLQEVEKVLSDVKAGDVRIIPAGKHFEWADYMVLATGRSAWHVKNIAQALVYKAKQKQKGNQQLILPSVEGAEGGKWIVVDSGKVIVHALDEKARAYYDLESLWLSEPPQKELNQDLEKAFVKIRPKNNSKKPAKVTV